MNSRSRDDKGKLDEWHEETGLASVIVGAPPQLRLALLVLTGRDTNTVLRSLISVPDTRVTPNVLRYTQLKGLAGQPLMSMFWWSPPKPSLTLPPTQFICSAAQPTWFHLWCWWPLWIQPKIPLWKTSLATATPLPCLHRLQGLRVQHQRRPYPSHRTLISQGRQCSPHQRHHRRLVPNNGWSPTGTSTLTQPLQHISGKDHDRRFRRSRRHCQHRRQTTHQSPLCW